MPKLHERQQFARPCALFSPARVDNSLQQACHLLGHSRRGLPRQRHGAALAGAASRWRSAVAGGRGSRTSVPDPWPRLRHGAEAAGSCGRAGRGPTPPSSTAAPCARRRGAASAASRPPQARARVVEKVRLSAQPPADRSVQRLIRRRRWTAPAHGWAARRRSWPPVGSATRSNRRCALPHRSAPQGAHKEGTGAAALCPCHCFLLTPHPPPGALRIAALLEVSGCAAPAGSWGGSPRRPGRPPNRGRRPPRCAGLLGLRLALCGLSSLLARLRNVLP